MFSKATALILACMAAAAQAATLRGESWQERFLQYNYDYTAATTSFLAVYIAIIVVLWVVPCCLAVCTLPGLRRREEHLPPQLKVVDNMLPMYALASVCCGLIGWGIGYWMITSNISQNTNMHMMQQHQNQQPQVVAYAK